MAGLDQAPSLFLYSGRTTGSIISQSEPCLPLALFVFNLNCNSEIKRKTDSLMAENFNKDPFEDAFREDQIDDENSEYISLMPSNESEELNPEDIPEEVSILPLKNTVLFPGVVVPITVGRDKSIKLINDARDQEALIGVAAQRSTDTEDPGKDDLHEVGTIARIVKLLKMPDGSLTVIIQGQQRFKVQEYTQEDPYLKATISLYGQEETPENLDTEEMEAMVSNMRELAQQIVQMSPNIPNEAATAITNIESKRFLLNFIASNLNMEINDKQELLEFTDLKQKGERILEQLNYEYKMVELKNHIQNKVKTEIDKQQREYFLQQQLKAIQEELGQDTPDKEIEDLKERAQHKNWGEVVEEQFQKELKKLQRMNPAAAEYSVIFNYLETMLDLPWNEYTEDKLDLQEARKILDEDHYGLESVKDRILEYLAVLKLKGDMKSPILCLHGPPGVGKTSLGKSIARSLGRNYNRMSLGGMSDESEIRGHRKTYIGAMPGRFIQSLKKVNSSNPVLVLDEIDKVGADFRGDPASALLEVLDPEQNAHFYDNYLEVEYDLSNVMFIATANNLDNVHPALRDRLEVIELSGYLQEEKTQIAKQHLIPKQREDHGLKGRNFKVSENVVREVIAGYTQESGVRMLEKQIGSLARAKAKSIVMEEGKSLTVRKDELDEILGPRKFQRDTYTGDELPGLATGLAWTPTGGEVLYIEVSLSPGKGHISLTGKLGDVMKESAQISFSYLKANYSEFGINPKAFDNWDIHVHIPEGSVPKEGPSAGVTMLTALASAFTQRKVKPKLAMTGEMTLRGSVLPVGGIKEKILAARRQGLTDIILSENNKKELNQIKAEYIQDLKIHYVNRVEEVIEKALQRKQVNEALRINHPDFANGQNNGKNYQIEQSG